MPECPHDWKLVAVQENQCSRCGALLEHQVIDEALREVRQLRSAGREAAWAIQRLLEAFTQPGGQTLSIDEGQRLRDVLDYLKTLRST